MTKTAIILPSERGVTVSLFEKVYVGSKAKDLNAGDELVGYSKVILQVSDDVQYEAGNDSGRTLTLFSPWGTQAAANNLLKSIQGRPYQSYTANGAIVDPAVELGDAVQAGSIYGGVYGIKTDFGHGFRADLSAPSVEEVDEEAPYKSKSDRKTERKFKEVDSTFKIQAGLIEARVTKTGGEEKSFGWALDEESWTIYSKRKKVLHADDTGLHVEGEITALSGKIGGLVIASGCLWVNKTDPDAEPGINSTNFNGLYIGPNGINLAGNFKVTSAGYVTAKSGKFGSLSVSSGQTSGNYYGNLSGCGGSISDVSGTVEGLSGSLSTEIDVGSKNIGTYVGDIVAGKITADYIDSKIANLRTIGNNGKRFSDMTLHYLNWNGTPTTVHVLGTQD